MATEFSAFTAIIAPDNTTFNYVKTKDYAPKGETWAKAKHHWLSLASDKGADFDERITIDCSEIMPTISWGTSPEQAISIGELIPQTSNPETQKQAMEYMDVSAGESLLGIAIQGAFIGSCTNGRLSDLKAAAEVLEGHRVAPSVKAVCTPGSAQVKQAAEAIGLDKIFIDAGFEWREPGCSLCFYAGGEGFEEGQRIVSTTNRNFKGRQGRGARTHITSPVMVAAAAIAGEIVDCRDFFCLIPEIHEKQAV